MFCTFVTVNTWYNLHPTAQAQRFFLFSSLWMNHASSQPTKVRRAELSAKIYMFMVQNTPSDARVDQESQNMMNQFIKSRLISISSFSSCTIKIRNQMISQPIKHLQVRGSLTFGTFGIIIFLFISTSL